MNIKAKNVKKQVCVKNPVINLLSKEEISKRIEDVEKSTVSGRELSKGAFEFSNTVEGFENARAWVLNLAAENGKQQIVLGRQAATGSR